MDKSGSQRKKILVVEDEPTIVLLFRRILTAEGFDVETIMNGAEARDRLRLSEYELLFFDIRTPGMNGKELYNWLKEYKPKEAKMVVFSTGDVMNGETHDFLEQTGRFCLPKPFTPQELKTITRKALGLVADE